jgi:hypothetical protein
VALREARSRLLLDAAMGRAAVAAGVTVLLPLDAAPQAVGEVAVAERRRLRLVLCCPRTAASRRR